MSQGQRFHCSHVIDKMEEGLVFSGTSVLILAIEVAGRRPERALVRAYIRALFIWNSGPPYSLTLVRATFKPSEPRGNPMEPSRDAVSTASFSNVYQCLQLSSQSPLGLSMSLCSVLSVTSSCSCLKRCFGIWSMSFVC